MSFSSPITRSTLAYFQHSGLDDFKDLKGNYIPQAEVIPDRTSLPMVTDALHKGPYQIGIQLLGFKLYVRVL